MIISLSNKKRDHLQEIRNPIKDNIHYRKRKQDEREADKYLQTEVDKIREEEHHAPIKPLR